MPRKPCYWTRKLELDLVEFVRQRDFIWKPYGNTNHHIQQKYKAYAEFAAKLGRGFTARSVRDRWVNIRSTFNHNLRRVDKSHETAHSPAELYVPCWPLWKPLQFLREVPKKEDTANYDEFSGHNEYTEHRIQPKIEEPSDCDENEILRIRQRGQITDKPHRKSLHKSKIHCSSVIEDLVKAMEPINTAPETSNEREPYWFFGRHVTERLNCMREEDAESACQDIMKLLYNYHDGFKSED